MAENKRFTDIGHDFKKLAKAFQDMVNANKKFNQALAKMVLSMPISMSYETWGFLHEIVDGDSE